MDDVEYICEKCPDNPCVLTFLSDCGDPLTTGELVCFACVEISSTTRLLKKIDALLEICK